MTDTQNCPTALTWQNCLIASLLASLPIVVAIIIGMIVERTDFPSASFFAYAIDTLGIALYQIGGGLLLWLGTLYFFRRHELRLGAAVLIGILVEASVRSAFVLRDTGAPSSWRPSEIAFYIVMSQFFLLPAGVIGGLLAWFYLGRWAPDHLARTEGMT